ncbi:MAG: HU family DNA-binding protein [Pseudomonadales bacterium]|nr:HU family DNA-binding protein [Pseudomonadales bacterium]
MAAKKKPVKKAVKKVVKKAAPPARKITAIKDPMSKTAILTEIADNTELSKKQVQAVFDELGVVIERHVVKRGAGMFTLPGLLKVTVVRKPATKSRKGINPFTGEETVFKAKPARNVVKIRPLKKLKDMAV